MWEKTGKKTLCLCRGYRRFRGFMYGSIKGPGKGEKGRLLAPQGVRFATRKQ